MSLREQIEQVLQTHFDGKVRTCCGPETPWSPRDCQVLLDRLTTLLSPAPLADREGLEKLLNAHAPHDLHDHRMKDTGSWCWCNGLADKVLSWASTGRTREQVREQVRERIAKIVIEKVYANLNPGGLTAKECELTKWLTNPQTTCLSRVR